jgi:hypothetical protein
MEGVVVAVQTVQVRCFHCGLVNVGLVRIA